MQPLAAMTSLGHEQVVFCRDESVGLNAIIAIHNTALGPSLGGCRLYPYASEAAALTDVLRLSRGMTYKAAIAGLDLGGGKAIIIGDPSIKSEGLFRAFGRFVESLGGRYITAEDMNTTEHDMNTIRGETRWVTGVSQHRGGLGDPSPVTAWGVFQGIRAALDEVFGTPQVEGRTIAIQGVGSVGMHLAQYLAERGANLLLTDLNAKNLQHAIDTVGGTVIDAEQFFEADCDVLAPCAIGGVINPRTIPNIRAPIIAGGANNVLEDEARDAPELSSRSITYVPDYVINGGGLISVNCELRGWPAEKALEDATRIYGTVQSVLREAKEQSCTTVEASDRIAQARLESIARVKDIYTSSPHML